LTSPEAKSFILFKKKLYTAFEARNRSAIEHDAFTSEVSLAHIYHMQESNNRHIAEINR